MKDISFTRILAPTDFSKHSELATQYALSWSESFNSQLRLMNVISYLGTVPLDGSFMIGNEIPLRVYEENAGRKLDKYIETLPRNGLSISSEVRSDDSPWHAIVDSAMKWKSDLIIMATHTRRGLGHLFMGSTASRVIEHTSCPVLLVRPGNHQDLTSTDAINRIVVPTDFSSNSICALPYAMDLAEHFQAELVFLHCHELSDTPDFYKSVLFRPGSDDEYLNDVLQEKMKDFLPSDITHQISHNSYIFSGRPERDLVEHAVTIHADLIVMATHGQTGRQHTLVGGTTRRVVRNAPCPVLLIPVPDDN